MRIQILMVIIVLALALATDRYIYSAIKCRCKNPLWRKVYLISAILLYLLAVVAIVLPKRNGADSGLVTVMWLLYVYLSFFFAKVIFILIDLVARIPQLFRRKRLKGLSLAGIVVACVAFFAMWWGALINRYNIDVEEVTVKIPTLPRSMDGLRVVQISDLHTGTWGNDTTFVKDVVDRINDLHPDVVFFTGDIVNRHSSELSPFVNTLSSLKAPMGVYAILGNHDYGDYWDWDTPADKDANMQQLYDLYSRIGWKLLLNETAWLHRGNDSIAVIGVENIGDPPFPVYGDLKKSYPGRLSDGITKILLTHNPSHWTTEVADNDSVNIALTLSGHTHAMQISVGHVSPAALRYKTWGGMYNDTSARHPLYVNIGVGTVGFPSRIGATPEITLFTLTR